MQLLLPTLHSTESLVHHWCPKLSVQRVYCPPYCPPVPGFVHSSDVSARPRHSRAGTSAVADFRPDRRIWGLERGLLHWRGVMETDVSKRRRHNHAGDYRIGGRGDMPGIWTHNVQTAVERRLIARM